MQSDFYFVDTMRHYWLVLRDRTGKENILKLLNKYFGENSASKSPNMWRMSRKTLCLEIMRDSPAT